MADGGTLALGLMQVNPVKDSLKHVDNVLEGSDAVMYQSVRVLGFELVTTYGIEFDPPRGAMVDKTGRL